MEVIDPIPAEELAKYNIEDPQAFYRDCILGGAKAEPNGVASDASLTCTNLRLGNFTIWGVLLHERQEAFPVCLSADQLRRLASICWRTLAELFPEELQNGEAKA